MSDQVSTFADAFADAARGGPVPARPSDVWPGFTLDDAYAIQKLQIDRFEAAGDRAQAIKLGLSQWRQQEAFGIPHVTFGTLTQSALLTPGEPFVMDPHRSVKVEAELVVVLGRDVTDIPADHESLLPALRSVHAGIEILESRFTDGISQPLDAVADNQAALSGVWRGEGRPVSEVDLAGETAVLRLDTGEEYPGVGSRILDNPLEAVFQAVCQRLERGFPVFEGLAIFTGNMCEQAVPVSPGNQVTVDFSTLGSLTLNVVAKD
jgi:2-oxo-3-hexenedioate decarboxylase